VTKEIIGARKRDKRVTYHEEFAQQRASDKKRKTRPGYPKKKEKPARNELSTYA